MNNTGYGGADMWVFGRTVKRRDVYIKITMGATNSSVNVVEELYTTWTNPNKEVIKRISLFLH